MLKYTVLSLLLWSVPSYKIMTNKRIATRKLTFSFVEEVRSNDVIFFLSNTVSVVAQNKTHLVPLDGFSQLSLRLNNFGGQRFHRRNIPTNVLQHNGFLHDFLTT